MAKHVQDRLDMTRRTVLISLWSRNGCNRWGQNGHDLWNEK